MRIAIIGAGSMTFATKLIGDILSFDALSDSEIILMDIDEDRLTRTHRLTEAMIDEGDVAATVESTTDRPAALDGADYVISLINVVGAEAFENEIRIPEKYGVKQAIGDTLGPGGVFRGLRTIPPMLELARDMEEHCPNALLLNYTNPMAIICWSIFEETDVETVGLCHSIPHTAESIADYTGVPKDEIDYWAAGINHMAWFLRCEHCGEDLYPPLHEAMEDPETFERDTVRFEMMKHFGAFVSESSHHMSEYVPYFRTDQEEIDRMKGTDHAGRMATASYLEGWMARSEERDQERAELDTSDVSIERSEEYVSRIIESIETDTPRRLNLNVRNDDGAISNLPADACVEVPCLIDGTGIAPCTVGRLPSELAALNQSNIAVQRLAVKGALENDRDAVHRAVKLDPLTSASLTLDEAHEMTEELIDANSEYLPALNEHKRRQ